MTKNQCISVTTLRTQTKKCLSNLRKDPKYIFVNNAPVAVLVDIDEYEKEFINFDFHELRLDEITPAMRRALAATRKKSKNKFYNLTEADL